jgi:hypothetical protein
MPRLDVGDFRYCGAILAAEKPTAFLIQQLAELKKLKGRSYLEARRMRINGNS